MGSLWGELKRRNVVKVGGAYAIVAWALVEIVATIEGPLGLPDWVDTLVIVLLAVGFPIALILSWAYDLTPQGIQAASAGEPLVNVAQVTGQQFNHVLLVLMVAILGFLVVDRLILAPSMNTVGADPSGEPPSGPTSAVQRLVIDVGPMNAMFAGLDAQPALSPDGTRLVFATRMQGDDLERLYQRPLDQFEVRAITGTEEAAHPFFSPDGERVAFFSHLGLATVSVRGGAPQTLVAEDEIDGAVDAPGTWVADDTIVYAKDDPTGSSLFRVPVAGGSPEVLLGASDEESYIQPAALPGGEAILLTIRLRGEVRGRTRDGSIAVLSLATGEVRTLVAGGFRPQYVSTGHIVFIRDGALWAVAFDADRLEITGDPVEVVRGVQHDGRFGGEAAAYAVSENGLLAFVPGGDVASAAGPRAKRLVWVDHEGSEEPLIEEPRDYRNPRLSPDGLRLAVTIADPDRQDIWIYDLARGFPIRLTREGGANNRALWFPDAQRVLFRSGRDGPGRIFSKAADGTGPVTRVSDWGTQAAFTPDGQLIVYGSGEFRRELRLLSMDGSGDSELLLSPWGSDNHDDSLIALSSRGDWMAYTSNETGREEIYVRPFPPDRGGRELISTGGGFEPRWAPDGRTLFYRNGEAMMSVAIQTEPEFSAGIPTEIFRGHYAGVDDAETPVARPSYDVSPVDGRFLMLKYADPEVQATQPTKFLVVDNWFEELRRLAPPTQ